MFPIAKPCWVGRRCWRSARHPRHPMNACEIQAVDDCALRLHVPWRSRWQVCLPSVSSGPLFANFLVACKAIKLKYNWGGVGGGGGGRRGRGHLLPGGAECKLPDCSCALTVRSCDARRLACNADDAARCLSSSACLRGAQANPCVPSESNQINRSTGALLPRGHQSASGNRNWGCMSGFLARRG